MNNRKLASFVLSFLALLLLLQSSGVGAAQATPKSASRLTGGEKCFKETGRCMHGLFLGYWERNGGVGQFGYPITDELEEGGRTVQYFERARFEWHQANAGTPYEVQLGQFGRRIMGGR